MVTPATTPNEASSDSEPLWLDADTLLYISKKQGQDAALYTVPAHGANRTVTRLAQYPVDISDLKYHAATQQLLFAARVYHDGNMTTAALRDEQKSQRHDSAMVFDQLFVRHWDTWKDGKKSNLFAVKLEKHAHGYHATEPLNLMAKSDLETPVSPMGSAHDYTFSSDGKMVAFVAKAPGKGEAWSTKQDVHIVPTDGHAAPYSLTSENKGACSFPRFHPNGYFLTWFQMNRAQYEADRRQIVFMNLATGHRDYIAFQWDRSPTEMLWSHDGKQLYVVAEEHGRNKVFCIDVASPHNHEHQVTVVVDKHANSGLEWLTSNVLLFTQSSMYKPQELYTLDTASGFTSRRTWATYDALRDVRLSKPEEFWFKGARGESVMGWLMRPYNFDPTKKYPVAFLIHGGPQSAWLDAFGTRWTPNLFAANGFVTVAINFHGSTGYGQAFTDSINQNWGSHPYQDLMKGLDHVINTYAFADGNRVAGLGASYGGYMINWINGHTDRFKCLVNHDGIFSTVSAYYTTEELYFPEFDLGGTPYNHRYMYERWNPEQFVKNWKTPTLVIHGAKDYRLVDGEGLATFTALQRQGVASKLVYFPDENHWVLKPGNVLRWQREQLDWITTYTKSVAEDSPHLSIQSGHRQFVVTL